MKNVRYTLILPPLVGIFLPFFASLNHTAAGSTISLQEYLMPLTVGILSGLLIGMLIDRNRSTLHRLTLANELLRKEVTRRCQLEDRYASLFTNNHSVILLIDPNSGIIEDANAAAANFYGYSLAKLKSMNINEINTMSTKETRKEMEKAGRNKRLKLSFKHLLSSGEIKDVEVYTGPIELEGKTYLLSIVNDVTELKQLKGIIPICSHCKQIRDDKGAWNGLEAYISKHSEADFSHGICPECIAKLYPDLELPQDK